MLEKQYSWRSLLILQEKAIVMISIGYIAQAIFISLS
jgi:hypothetical protein